MASHELQVTPERQEPHVLPSEEEEEEEEDRLPSPADPPKPGQTTARCHCGRISLDLPAPPQKINECRCSVCYRYGALWGYYHADQVNIFVNIVPAPVPSETAASTTTSTASSGSSSGPSRGDNAIKEGLRSYVRSDSEGDIAFFFCGHCGCLTHWAATDKGRAFLRQEKLEKGDEAREPKIGVNCRMIAPRLLEEVERKVGKFQDFY